MGISLFFGDGVVNEVVDKHGNRVLATAYVDREIAHTVSIRSINSADNFSTFSGHVALISKEFLLELVLGK